jgi:hypothetical protein
MLTDLIARLAVPKWLAQVLAALAVVAALVLGARAYLDHVYNNGVAAERSRRDTIDAKNSAAAERARADLNARIRALQGTLATARAVRDRLQLELDHEKTISNQRQADLLAGRARERVLVRAAGRTGQAGADGKVAGTCTGALDRDAAVEVDLDPGVASWLEGVRSDHNGAVKRLDACIKAYGAVKAAADAMP